jgi:predicted O-linked N-acetylglucosamine transferase (SPINDLY family)
MSTHIELSTRVFFFCPRTDDEFIKGIAAVQILLDPFPVSGYWHCLEALAMGIPVVTFPSDKLSGKQAEALYSILDYSPDELIVDSEASYVKAALALAHSKSTRLRITQELLDRRHLLFNQSAAVEDWTGFFAAPEVVHMLQT